LEGRGKDISGKPGVRPVGRSVSIDVPAEIWVLVSKDELLKKAMERIAVEEFRKLF
jgi:hypothetical protein